MKDQDDILENNVSSLLDTSGDVPRMTDVARARIRAKLIAEHARDRRRSPALAIGAGLAAVAAAAAIATLVVKRAPTPPDEDNSVAKLDDGSTFITDTGAHVSVLGPRHVRVDGAALLDIVPGKGTFVVETARGRIEVLGTRFLVDGEVDKTTTAVVRGQVKLVSADGDVVLHAGEQGVVEQGRPPTRMPAPRLSHLVSWAREARHKAEHDLAPLHNGTLYAREPNRPWVPESPLPLANLTVDAVVEDRVARVALDQTFHNPAPQDMEGMYRFTIPPDAALQRLAMYVDGKLTESAVVERMAARRIYEEQVYRRVDPALLEWAGTGKLALRVYPLPAQQDKRLMVAYTQSLPKLYDDWTLTVPLPDVDEPVGNFEVNLKVAGCANCELTSTSHTIEVTRKGDDAFVHAKAAGVKIGDSLVVHVREAHQTTTVATATDGNDRFVLVRAPGSFDGKPATYKPRTWVILDDVSASRDELARRAQADLIEAFLRELDEDDKVSILAFDVTVREKLAPTRVLDVDHKAVRAALAKDGGVGATDFEVALDAAMKQSPDMIVYLGDGVISAGTRHLDELRAKLVGKTQFVGVGVGDGPDTQTLDALAAATGGYSTTIDLADDLGWRAFDLVAALHTTRVTGVEAHLVDAAGKLVPATLYPRSAQLADGEELELVGKLAGGGTPVAVEVSGSRDGQAWTQRIALDHAKSGAKYLPRLWAQRHIAARLLEKHEPVAMSPCVASKTAACPSQSELRDQRDEVIRKDVVALGKKYFLLSRHTSLLVLENDDMYAKYGITKGSGDTWAPYAMPATIPVKVTPAAPVVASNVADDALLVRKPIAIFYDYSAYPIALANAAAPSGRISWEGDVGGVEGGFEGQFATRESLQLGTKDTDSTHGAADPWDATIVTARPASSNEPAEAAKADDKVTEITAGEMALDEGKMGKRDAITLGTGGFGYGVGGGRGGHGYGGYWSFESDRRAQRYYGWAGPLVAQRLTYASDPAFDDLTEMMPALEVGEDDAWRKLLGPAATTPSSPDGGDLRPAGSGAEGRRGSIDDAAAALLAKARAALPSGIYRWGDVELAVDDARHIGWHRTTQAGLAEAAALTASAWTRRYAELGVDATRAVGTDDIAVALAYLPVWIAEPAHYAAYFTVRSRGAHQVALSRTTQGKDELAFVLTFDDRTRLVSITDKTGRELIAVTWNDAGPTGARVLGDKVAVGYTATAMTDATAWALGTTAPGTLVELPSRVPAYWLGKAGKADEGSPAWRHAERQLLVSYAALKNIGEAVKTFRALQAHGGVEPGDIVLASGAIATGTTDDDFTTALAGSDTLATRYLQAGRRYGKSPRPDALVPATRDGLIGSLWALRHVVADLGAGRYKDAAAAMSAIGAPELRLIAAAAIAQTGADADAAVEAWDSVATGPYKNAARAQAAQALYQRGNYDAAAARVVQLVAELDLDAAPPQLQMGPYIFQASRRGNAGWQLVWAQWRDRVLDGGSFEHVMSLFAATQGQPADMQRVLARAAELAGDDTDRVVTVAQTAWSYGQIGMAQAMLEPLVKKAPSRELYQLVAQIAQQQGRYADALADLEAAQDAGADERVGITEVRRELGAILALARQVAIQSTGKARQDAVAHALAWGDRWRALDPGNTQIDVELGELELAVGDKAEAWRQLSSVIERDPMSGGGYEIVATAFEQQGRVAEALDYWEQAIRIDQTDPTPRLHKAQALIALGRDKDGEAVLRDIASRKWHDKWSNVVYEAQDLLQRSRGN